MPGDMPPRLYQRVRPTNPGAAKAQIIVSPKSPSVACRLIDYSPGGACLEVFPMVALPDRIELLHGNVRKRGRIVWRRGIRIGVAF
jgi:PilZ domain